MVKTLIASIFGLILSCFAQTGQAIEIYVTTDRNLVNLNDSFQIIFSASDNPDGDPDFNPLYQDFEVLNQSHSSQSSWVNGSFTKNIKWVLDVMPKNSGVLTIPAINFGRNQSQPSSILVNKAEKTKTDIQLGEDLFLLVDVSTTTPYVQQQVIYTLRLYRKVDLSQARLTEPKLVDAVIEKLGDDKDYNTQFQGEYYTVTERKYAIFPQKSGAMTIDPLSLTAAVVIGNRSSRFSGFFSRPATRTKRVVSDAVELNVKPVPKSFTGKHWLPAEQVHLQEQWSNDNLQVNVGEPLTRTLTLLIKGATVGQLPELSRTPQIIQTEAGGELKRYPDQPVLKDQAKENSMLALREEKVALIPSQAGNYQLPAIEVPWWNTQTDQMEITKIAAKTLQAIAVQGITKSTPTTKPDFSDASAPNQPVTSVPAQKQYGWMGLSAFLALGWFLTALYLLKERQKANNTHETVEPRLTNDGIKALKKACRENKPAAAKDALICWGQLHYGASSLGKIAPFCAAGLKQEIENLNQQLYSKENSQWNGKKLWQSFNEHISKAEKTKPATDELEPLYRL